MKTLQLTLSLLILALFAVSTTMAQSQVPPCFCCDPIAYQLTPNPPPITGPTKICPCGGDIFKTIPCPGATIVWTVATNTGTSLTFTGQSTNQITLNSFSAGTATSVTVTVKITCGRQSITNHITVPVVPKPDLTFNWQVTYSGSGDVWTVAAQGTGNWMSYGNAWRITEVTPSDKPCNQWGYGPVCIEQASQNISTTCTLLPGHQYRIIHWMEKCSPTWHATAGCLAVKVVCFTMTPPTGKMARPSKGMKAVLENVSEAEVILTPDMMKGLTK